MRKYLIPIAGLCLIMIIILCVRITGRVNDNTYSAVSYTHLDVYKRQEQMGYTFASLKELS